MAAVSAAAAAPAIVRPPRELLYRWRVTYACAGRYGPETRQAWTRGPWRTGEQVRRALLVHGLDLVTAERAR